jgi:hypothetical protein
MYNCVAYAAGDFTRKWWPSVLPNPGYYWPPGAARGDGPDALRSGFDAIGYEQCVNGDNEPGYEKVVIYVDDNGDVSHVAKQDGDGWISKLGEIEDVYHRTPHCFGGSIYGNVVYYMRRKTIGMGYEKPQEIKEDGK